MAQTESSLTKSLESEQLNALCSFIDQIFEPSRKLAEANPAPSSTVIAKRGSSFNIGPVVFYFMYDVEDFDYQAPLVRQGDPNNERMDVSVSFLKSLGVL